MDTDGIREAFDRADRNMDRAESNPLMTQVDLRQETKALRRATAYYLRGMSLYVRGLIDDGERIKAASMAAPAVTDWGNSDLQQHGVPAVEWLDGEYHSTADLDGHPLFIDQALGRWRVFVDGHQQALAYGQIYASTRDGAKQAAERIARAQGRS